MFGRLSVSVTGKRLITMTFFGLQWPREALDRARAEERTLPTVMQDRAQVLKVIKAEKEKSARFKAFSSREEAEQFAQEENDPTAATERDEDKSSSSSAEPSCPYKSLTPQQMHQLKKCITMAEMDALEAKVAENPRYLVTPSDTPAVLHSGTRANALHVAAGVEGAGMARRILELLTGKDLWQSMYPIETDEQRTKRMEYVLDLYLNMPNKGHFDTPLHVASKTGNLECVRLLTSFSSCDPSRENKMGLKPSEVACSRSSSDDKDLKQQIVDACDGLVYIPVIRSDENVTGAIGEPLSPQMSKYSRAVARRLDQVSLLASSPRRSAEKLSSPLSSSLSPKRHTLSPSTPESSPILLPPKLNQCHFDSKDPLKENWPSDPDLQCSPRSVSALLGPLSPQDARRVKTEWQKSTPKSVRLRDPQKAYECNGRLLAKQFESGLLEYWDFLGDYIDLSKVEGLVRLENHLMDMSKKLAKERELELEDFSNVVKKLSMDDEDDDLEDDAKPVVHLSPMSELARDLASLRLTSPSNETHENISFERRVRLDGSYLEDKDTSSEDSYQSAAEEEGQIHDFEDFLTASGGFDVFLKGDKPSASDGQVFRALDVLYPPDNEVITVFTFPHLHGWLDSVRNFPEEERNKWGNKI